MARVAELWAPELRQPASWLRRRLIEAAVDGLFDMEYPLIGLTLLDPTTQAQRRVFSVDLADFGRSPQAADLVASFRKKRRELDLLDIVEAMTGCDLVVGRAAVLALAARWKLPAPSFWAEPAAPEPAGAEAAGPMSLSSSSPTSMTTPGCRRGKPKPSAGQRGSASPSGSGPRLVRRPLPKAS